MGCDVTLTLFHIGMTTRRSNSCIDLSMSLLLGHICHHRYTSWALRLIYQWHYHKDTYIWFGYNKDHQIMLWMLLWGGHISLDYYDAWSWLVSFIDTTTAATLCCQRHEINDRPSSVFYAMEHNIHIPSSQRGQHSFMSMAWRLVSQVCILWRPETNPRSKKVDHAVCGITWYCEHALISSHRGSVGKNGSLAKHHTLKHQWQSSPALLQHHGCTIPHVLKKLNLQIALSVTQHNGRLLELSDSKQTSVTMRTAFLSHISLCHNALYRIYYFM